MRIITRTVKLRKQFNINVIIQASAFPRTALSVLTTTFGGSVTL